MWLRDALEQAGASLGSKALAKDQLIEWLAAGTLPWSCTSWKGLDEEGIARRRREKERKWKVSGVLLSAPSAGFHAGDPRFFRVRVIIDWEDNTAREGMRAGAQALGIKVSPTHLLALLPKESHEREQLVGAARWVAAEARRMKAAGEVPDRISHFALALANRMRKAAATNKSIRPIKSTSIKNRLREWGLWPPKSIK